MGRQVFPPDAIKKSKVIKKQVILAATIFIVLAEPDCYLPINTSNRKSLEALELTDIGSFGLRRKERKSVPAHYHTGIDIKRPSKNYQNEPIFPLLEGVVISKREDGPYAQLILEHKADGQKIWTVYEHIAGIAVNLKDRVNPKIPIARFMSTAELNKHGWQFDHFHLEVLKVQPLKMKPVSSTPDRHCSSYSLVRFTKEELDKYFYDPVVFLKEKFK